MTLRKYFLAIFLILLICISNAVLGFKKESDCGDYLANNQLGELALCYNEVAVSYASLGDKAHAEHYCTRIQSVPSVYAESQANNCFADVARILKDNSTCNMITQNQYQQVLTGGAVTQDICNQNANKQLEKPMCSTVLIILLPLLGGLFFFRTAHKF